ncbi:MAG: acetyl-CoA carboxylase biotin carboxyl carrier protein [Clostridium sp.]|uniref:acetyl-CoA carboxylase biotin carboxyl carrier protein n=1 Tax=Clostridium sp. TaxID=1506 RepID=UPI003F403771
MDIREVKELIQLINSTDVAYLEIQSEKGSIKIDKSFTRNTSEEKKEVISKKEDFNNYVKEEKIIEKEVKVEEKIEEAVTEGTVIKSPMVGTFYSSPSPDSDKFVSLGKKVSKGDVLCIIEAMKLMNEIESDFNGEIVEILVKDGDMIEYGTPLFKIKES